MREPIIDLYRSQSVERILAILYAPALHEMFLPPATSSFLSSRPHSQNRPPAMTNAMDSRSHRDMSYGYIWLYVIGRNSNMIDTPFNCQAPFNHITIYPGCITTLQTLYEMLSSPRGGRGITASLTFASLRLVSSNHFWGAPYLYGIVVLALWG